MEKYEIAGYIYMMTDRPDNSTRCQHALKLIKDMYEIKE